MKKRKAVRLDGVATFGWCEDNNNREMEIINLDYCNLSGDCLVSCRMNKPEKIRKENKEWRKIIRFTECVKKLF